MAAIPTDLFHSWFEWQKKNHDAAWANRCIKTIRMFMLPLVSPGEAAEGMNYLLGQQSLDYVQNCFQDTTGINLTNQNNIPGRILNQYGTAVRAADFPLAKADNHNEILSREMRPVSFTPVDLLSKLYKINIAEMRKMGPIANVISNDPTSTERRKKDKALIENKKQIERDLSKVHTQIGQPPVKLEQMEDRFGIKPGNGNVGEFQAMGLNEDDKSDVKFFMDYFHRLWEEMAAQEIIDLFMKDNEVSEKIPKWTRDLWAKNAIAGQVYVSETTGKTMFDYVAPETVFIYGGGRREDYNDANAKAIQKRVTVKEMLGMFGNSFDFDKDWNRLLQAITYSGGPSFENTGIYPSARGYFLNNEPLMAVNVNGIGGAPISQVDFMQFRITIGYIEWSSQEQDSFEDTKSETEALFANNQPGNGQRYQTKARYQTPTYKSWYLAVTALDQMLFEFGPQTYQQIEGYNDVNVNFTIITWKGVGRALAMQAKPHLDIYHEAWFKFRYILRRSKPPGTEYDYDSLLAMANDMFMDTEGFENRLQKTLQFLDGTVNIITKRPVNENGEHYDGQLTREIANGVSPDAKIYWDVMTNSIMAIKEILTGSSPLREGDPGGSRDSMNNQFKALEYSQNATSFVPDALTYMFQQGAVKTMLFAQDIFQFKDHNILPYNYYIDGVGQDTIDKIAALGNKAMHRFGIFVESLNQTAARAKLSARIDFALQQGAAKGGISNAQALLVERIESPQKAYLWLAYFEDKNVKVAQQNAMEQQKQAQDAAQALQQGEMAMVKMKIDGDLQGKAMDNQTVLQQHANTNNTGITKQAMKSIADLEGKYHDLHTDLIRMMAEQGKIPVAAPNILPPPPPPTGQPGPSGPPPPQNRPLSAIAQGMQQAQPMPTGVQ